MGGCDMERVANLTYKPLSEFEQGDTIYISKMHGGFQAIYFCVFMGFERGIVKAIVKSDGATHGRYLVGEPITTKPNKCMVWGWGPNDNWDRIHWFKKIKKGWQID
jgi:hypothetical protein